MLEEGQIHPYQLGILITITIMATAIIFLPAITAKHAGQGAWISTLWAMVNGLIIAGIVILLQHRFPEDNLAGALGKMTVAPLGRFLALVYSLWFLHINSVVIREFGEFLNVAFYQETPPVVIFVTLMVTVVFAVRSGLEVMGRVAVIIFWLSFPLYFLMIFLALPVKFTPERLLPLWNEIVPTWQGALPVSAWMGEVVAISFLYPYLNRKKGAGKYVGGGLILVGITLALTAVASVSLFGAAEVGRQNFPAILLIRHVRVATIIDRQEPVLLFIWVSGILVKTSVFLYISCITLAQGLGLKDFRSLAVPLSVLLIALSLFLFESSPQVQAFLDMTWPPYAAVFELLIPLSILLLSFFLPGRVAGNE